MMFVIVQELFKALLHRPPPEHFIPVIIDVIQSARGAPSPHSILFALVHRHLFWRQVMVVFSHSQPITHIVTCVTGLHWCNTSHSEVFHHFALSCRTLS